MTYDSTLLGFTAQRHTIGLEDVATDALCFILSRSDASLRALSDSRGMNPARCPLRKHSPGLLMHMGQCPT